MAKISARGAREIARWHAPKIGYKITFVLASDGRLLSKMGSQSGYSIVGRLKAGTDAERIESADRYLTRRYPGLTRQPVRYAR